MSHINAQLLVGTPNQQNWTQVQKIERDNGLVILVIKLRRLESGSALDLSSIGGAIVEKFHASKGEGLSNRQYLEWAKSEISDLAQNEIEIGLMIAKIDNEDVWLWGEGEVEALLYRFGKIAKLTVSKEMSQGISGKLQVGDKLLIGSSVTTKLILEDKLREVIGESDFAEELGIVLHTNNRGAELGLGVVEIRELSNSSPPETNVASPRFLMPKISVKRMLEEPRKLNLWVGGGAAIGLLCLVFLGLYSRANKNAAAEYENNVTKAVMMVEEASSVSETNPERAKILLTQGKEMIKKYIESEPRSVYLHDAESELDKINTKEAEILRVRGIGLKPTIELSMIGADPKASRMSSDKEGVIAFWNEETNNIVGASVADLSKIALKTEGITSVVAMNVLDGFYTMVGSEGVWRGSSSKQELVIPSDETWGEIAGVETYGSNIYLLDTQQGEIWKYSASGEGYGERRRWFGAGIILDLSRIVDWVVDGDVWLLSSSGKVERYSRGVPVAFELIGLPTAASSGGLVDPAAITVVDEKLYVLERGAKRVLAFDQDGKYLQQYVSEEFEKASDLVVYDDKGYVLVEGVIKEWGL